MKRPTEFDRRTYLGATAAALVGGVPLAVGATGNHGDSQGGDDGQSGRGQGDEEGEGSADGRDEPATIPGAQPFVGDLDGEDLSGDMEFQVRNGYDGDPADGGDGREWVLHYTTDGVETQDYPAALINVHERIADPVTLGELRADDGVLEFDFFVGKGHDQYRPGQVYLVVQTPEQAGNDHAWGLYRNVRKGPPKGEWRTLDVVEEMSTQEPDHRGRDPVWRALEIDVDPEGFRCDFETFSEAILERATRTRDGEGATFGDVFAEYGDDAVLLGAGFGSGSSRTPTRRDVYYDDFRVGVGGESWTFELPAALPMDAAFESDGQITATLSFANEGEDVSLADVDEETVQLYPFAQVMPPMGEGAEPSRVDVGEDELEARFPPGRVRELEAIGGGSNLVAVAGRFDYDQEVWFFGIGEATVPGN